MNLEGHAGTPMLIWNVYDKRVYVERPAAWLDVN